jgi:hypothetical protein
MCFVKRSAKATEIAAAAAKKSAETAANNVMAIRELANLERPWICAPLVDFPEPSYTNDPLPVMFYGRIQYYDTSRRDLHVTRFCYRWYIENDQLMLDSVGPRNYIEYT